MTGNLPLPELCSFTEDISTSLCIDFGSSKDCILVKDADTPFPADLAFATITGQSIHCEDEAHGTQFRGGGGGSTKDEQA